MHPWSLRFIFWRSVGIAVTWSTDIQTASATIFLLPSAPNWPPAHLTAHISLLGGRETGGGLWPNPPLLSAFLAWRQAGVGEGILDPRVLSATHSSLSWPCNYTLQNAPGLTPSPKARARLGGAADPTMPTYRLEAREGSCPSAAAGSGGSWELQSASLKAKRACTPFRQPESIPRQFHNLPCNADLDNFLRMHFLK